jgi:hypothetical protein
MLRLKNSRQEIKVRSPCFKRSMTKLNTGRMSLNIKEGRILLDQKKGREENMIMVNHNHLGLIKIMLMYSSHNHSTSQLI